MSDYAGAIAAIKSRLLANWATTPIGFLNEKSPVDEASPTPWVFFEIVSAGSVIEGFGKPGSQVIPYDGLIRLHVFVPTGSGVETGFAHALALGEIFRNQVFYDDITPGCYVRTETPRIDDGDEASEDGMWFRITATIPFTYWHRG